MLIPVQHTMVMRFILTLFICSMVALPATAQSDRQAMRDQLEARFGTSPGMQTAAQELPGRCLLPYHQMYEEVGDEISPEAQSKMKDLLSVTAEEEELQEYLSESGKFRILYSIEGPDSIPATDSNNSGIPDYVEMTADYADSSYHHQVDTLGFVDPTVHQGAKECRSWALETEGAEELPDTVITIRFRDFFNYYGQFDPNSPFEFLVHHNFENFPDNDDPEGNVAGALKATIAHEFKHVIQYATNCMKGDAGENAWVEMDATMMEEIVYPLVNDYHNYIKGSTSVFNKPEYSVPAYNDVNSSYNQVTWVLFFAEYYGMDFWVNVWDRIYEDHFINYVDAMSLELEEAGDDFESALIRNHLWHLASGSRSLEVTPYGFSEGEIYPDATVVSGYKTLPDFLGMEVDVPLRAARYFEFTPETAGVSGSVGMIHLYDDSSTGMGFLAKKKNGEIEELIFPSTDANPLNLSLPLEWEDIAWMGAVSVNSNIETPINSQLYAGIGEQEQMERLYGDVTLSGGLIDEDAAGLLQFKLNPATETMFHRHVGDVSGNGSLSHYDASYLYRYLEGDNVSFPVDEDGSGLALKWEDGTVFPAAKPEPTDGVTDTVEVQLEMETVPVVAEQEMEMVLSVPGASDSTWYSLYLELDVDYISSDTSDDTFGLDFIEDLSANNDLPEHEGWEFERSGNLLKLAFASSAPFSSNQKQASGEEWATYEPDDLLTLRFVSQNEGEICFEIVRFELDEHNYAVKHEPRTFNVMGPVEAGPPAETPVVFELEQNFPNPFNPETTIAFSLAESGPVRLDVFDITGRRVATLVDQELENGRHTVRFDAGDYPGLASGVYLYRLQTTNQREVRKMTIIK